MAKILVNGMEFVGTVAECKAFMEMQAKGKKAKATKGNEAPKSAKKSVAKKVAPKKSVKGNADTGFVINGKVVEATRYLRGAIYTYNKANAEKLGATIGTNAKKLFQAAFTSVAKANEFHKIATMQVPDEAYASIQEGYKAKTKTTRPNKDIAKAMREATKNDKLNCNGENWTLAIQAYDKGGIKQVKAIAKQYK